MRNRISTKKGKKIIVIDIWQKHQENETVINNNVINNVKCNK